MFKGSVDIKIETVSGFDIFGNPDTVISKSQTVRGAALRLKSISSQSLSTSSASSNSLNASANSLDTSSIILVPPSSIVYVGDKLTVRTTLLMVMSKDEKFDVYGIHDHTRLECVLWQ
jgi:hypothetical protein